MKIGDRVRALRTVTEDGKLPGDSMVEFPHKNYIHAVVGDQGEVVHMTDLGAPTIKFDRTGTATIIGLAEVELVSS